MIAQRPTNKRTLWRTIAILFSMPALLAACDTSDIPTPCPVTECPEATCPEPVLYEDQWASSGHADKQAEPFTHWDNDNPPEIPVECAKCHSKPGFIDFLGIDGSTPNQVDQPAKVGTIITCYTCHNDVSRDVQSAEFPSGTIIRGLGPEAICIQCHQGRASTVTVDDAIAELGLVNDDISNPELPFINSHSISGATPFGTEVRGAYEYEGKSYAGRFVRGDEFFGCIRCHNQHTLELKFETCGECHTINGTDPRNIRVNTTDFDGDGDNQEGIAYEIEDIQGILLDAIQSYARDRVGILIAYDSLTYPYFFVDTNGNGEVEPDEADSGNEYLAWTPRMLRAVYNYNYVSHDPGAFAHNSIYTIQVLYDSLVDIGGDTTGLTRP